VRILLSTAYLPPVQYTSKFLLTDPVRIENHENYQKQSYRNRCYIYGANGCQCLVIPVIKQGGENKAIAEVEIDYQYPWQKIHLRSIQSAYRNSPFYEFYADDFNEFFREKIPLLTDWNLNLLLYILKVLNIASTPVKTSIFEKNPGGTNDFRNAIHPKLQTALPDEKFKPVIYQQVFRDRYGFIPNLSIIDLIFNEGPQARELLFKTIN